MQEFIEIETLLLLTFFIFLHNQLSSIHSIVPYQRVQIFEKDDSSNRQKINDCSFQSVSRQILYHKNLSFSFVKISVEFYLGAYEDLRAYLDLRTLRKYFPQYWGIIQIGHLIGHSRLVLN